MARTKSDVQPEVPASAFYGGRGFGLAVEAAKNAKRSSTSSPLGWGWWQTLNGCRGTGLRFRVECRIVVARISGEFDAAAWFSGLLAGPYSKQWADLMAVRSGSSSRLPAHTPKWRVAASSNWMAGFWRDCDFLERRSRVALPAALRPALAPYDARLDTILPGTRADFSQRALIHFVKPSPQSARRKTATAILPPWRPLSNGVAAPVRLRRPRRTDEEILQANFGTTSLAIRYRAYPSGASG